MTALLQGCPLLNDLRLDRCLRITDAAFDSAESLFAPLIGCLSLEAISLQGCPQLTGSVVATLNKLCLRLQYLNLSQCKRIESSAIQRIFQHHQLISLNLSYIDGVSDDAFYCDPYSACTDQRLLSLPSDAPIIPLQLASSPLQKLFLSRSTITDTGMFRMSFLGQLREIGLQWCAGITDEGVVALSSLCSKLQVIDLKSCSISDVSVRAVSKNCTDLRHLDLSWCMGISDAGFLCLAEHAIANYLLACDSNVVVELAEHESSNSPKQSAASSNYIKDKRSSRGLQSLHIVWCSQLTDATIVALLRVPSLIGLDLSGCTGMSEAGVKDAKDCGIAVKSDLHS